MIEFRNLIILGLLTGLFIFALVNISISLTNENNVNNTLLENEAINKSFGYLQSNLSDSQSKSETSKTGFEVENPTVGTDSFLFSSIISAGKVFTGMWRGVYDITFSLFTETLGINPVVMGVITSILLITIILLAWSLYKSGR